MSLLALTLIVLSLVTYVTGQLLVKKGMERATCGLRTRSCWLAAGIAAMSISFFLTLGLLQRFELSYLYPFNGLSVVLIGFTATLLLGESMTLRLAAGSALIALGVLLVALS